MTLSRPTDDRPNTRYSCRLAAGSGEARIGPLDPKPIVQTILSQNVQFALEPPLAHPTSAVSQSWQTPGSTILKHHAVAKSP